MDNTSTGKTAQHLPPDAPRASGTSLNGSGGSVATDGTPLSRHWIKEHLRPRRHSDELLMAYEPFSAEADRYRHVRNHLLTMLNAPAAQSLAVISPSSSHKASAFVANLAICFSHVGMNTLLVDADLRNPKQHDLFQLSTNLGLSDMLSENTRVDGIHPIPDIPGLSVITAGTLASNPQDLLSRPALPELCRRLLRGYEMVIYDMAAGDHTSDYLAVASQTRNALIMAQQNTTTVQRLKAIERSLLAIGCSVVGSVMLEA